MSSSRFNNEKNLVTGKEEWLTPPFITQALGPFDLDPCSPVNRPWPTARKHFTINDDGLRQAWEGFVFCNPPYGPKLGVWLAKMARHGNGIALCFARTETAAFQQFVWPYARAVLFIKGRLSFYHVSGQEGGTAGAPSVLIAYGEHAANILRGQSKIAGHLIEQEPLTELVGK